MIYFCLSGYDWPQKEKDDMIQCLKDMDFVVDDLGSVIFAKYSGLKYNAIITSEVFTGELKLVIFESKAPEHTCLTIRQKRLNAVYSL